MKSGRKSRLLLKISGDLDHGSGEVLKPDSTGYRILERFVRRSNDPEARLFGKVGLLAADNALPFFERLEMMSPRRLLRRVTLSLAGRLPTKNERAAVAKGGLNAVDSILDDVMKEDAFYERLQEAFNDILLTRGYDGFGEDALSYEHFKSRHWYQDRDPRRGLSLEKEEGTALALIPR